MRPSPRAPPPAPAPPAPVVVHKSPPLPRPWTASRIGDSGSTDTLNRCCDCVQKVARLARVPLTHLQMLRCAAGKSSEHLQTQEYTHEVRTANEETMYLVQDELHGIVAAADVVLESLFCRTIFERAIADEMARERKRIFKRAVAKQKEINASEEEAVEEAAEAAVEEVMEIVMVELMDDAMEEVLRSAGEPSIVPPAVTSAGDDSQTNTARSRTSSMASAVAKVRALAALRG